MHIGNRFTKYAVTDKRHRSVNGSILLPLALRYRLLCVGIFGLFLALVLPSVVSRTVSAASITLSISPALSVDVTPTATGTFATSEGTITVDSDAPFGYELSINSGNSSNALTSGTNTLPSITEEIDENTFKSDDKYSNTWGFKPSKKNGTANTRYLPGPSADASIIIDTTESKSTGAVDYTITLGTKVNNEQLTGSYVQNFIVTAAAKAVNYTINYDDNGGTGGPGTVTGKSFEETITLDSRTPTRNGYEFKGWCDRLTTNESCAGTTYQPESSYILSNSANAPTFYAMWKQNSLQEPVECQLLIEIGQTGTITDKRGGATIVYPIARLKDGRCWMIENLRLGEGKEIGEKITLTSDDSDITPGNTFEMSITTEKHDCRSSDDSTRTNCDAAYINPEYGGYYSWHTATAGSGTYEVSAYGDNATDSICPKGWRLPTGDSYGEFQALATAYGDGRLSSAEVSKALQDTPAPGFKLGGHVQNINSGFVSKGSMGYYWSSTVTSGVRAKSLHIDSGIVNPATSSDYVKHAGFSLRCIADGLSSMQKVSEWGDLVQEGQTVTAIDERDGNIYTVSRLKDGRLWMTQNLRLGDYKLQDRNLSSTNTDLANDSTFMLPASNATGFDEDDKAYVYVDPGTTVSHKDYGGYYSWYAATAGTGTKGMSGEASNSICPKGWHLPTLSDFETLLSNGYDYSTLMESPANFIPSGAYTYRGPSSQGWFGYWTSSTAAAFYSDHIITMQLASDDTRTAASSMKEGHTIRCVAR